MKWHPPSPLPTTHHYPSLPPQASEMAEHLLGWRAQLNPKLMMVVEGRDPAPAGTAGRGGRGGVAEAARLLGTTLHNSSFQ